MAPTLIVLALLAVAAVVIWFVRKKPAPPVASRDDADTAWNDPITPTDVAPSEPTRSASSTEEPRP